MGGGQANLLQYYMGAGGSAETPKLYYVIYEQPLINIFKIVLIDIDIDIFKIVLIAISIFSRMALLILISIFSRLSFLMSILISIFVKSVDISTIAISYRYIANRARCGCTPTCLVSEIRYLFYNIVDGVYHENGILHQFLRSIKTTMRNMTPT